jgi:hypothetical protein
MAAGAPSHGHRVVRALKNRFGSTSEVGLFQMGEEGFTEAQPAQPRRHAGRPAPIMMPPVSAISCMPPCAPLTLCALF